jgi:hypothetical protein
MLNRNKVLVALLKYFEQKGRVLSPQEYARETDTPVRIQAIKEVFGSWKKMEIIIMATQNGRAESRTNVNELIRQRGAAEQAKVDQWVEASENQDVKARREAEAQVVAEVLAKNAATPEGANANKIAIGGKLPAEQQDFTAMGATVKTDPATLEQTVVDTKPEVVTPALDNPKTPQEIRDAIAAEGVSGGSIPVGKATAGGSSGQPSKDTVNALGGDTAADDVSSDTLAAKDGTKGATAPKAK